MFEEIYSFFVTHSWARSRSIILCVREWVTVCTSVGLESLALGQKEM